VLPLLLSLFLARADPGLGATWERRAPRDLDPAAEAAPAARPPASDPRSAPGDGEAEASERRRAGEAAEETAREAEARRRAAEERLRAAEETRTARLAAVEGEIAAREEARLARETVQRELAVGGGAVLVLAAGAALVWRSLRRQR
jgi:hypothetical protein